MHPAQGCKENNPKIGAGGFSGGGPTLSHRIV